MWEKALPWIGGIFAGVGLIIIFYEVIMSIKKRNKTKLHIVGLVLLSVAVIGYVFTDIIFTKSAWPPLASLIWLALFWAYVIMDACVTFGAVRKHRRDAKASLEEIKKQEEQDVSNDDGNVDETETNQPTHGEDSATDVDAPELTTDDQSATDDTSTDNKKKKHKRRK